MKLLCFAFVCILISTLFEGFQFSLVIPVADKILSDGTIILPSSVPAPLAALIEKINAIDRLTLFWIIVVSVIVILVLKHFFRFWKGYFMNDVSQRVMREVRYEIYQKIQNLSLDYFSKKRGGELIARITNDVQIIENAHAVPFGDQRIGCV